MMDTRKTRLSKLTEQNLYEVTENEAVSTEVTESKPCTLHMFITFSLVFFMELLKM